MPMLIIYMYMTNGQINLDLAQKNEHRAIKKPQL